MANIKKILVVGEHLSGKSSIIQTFKEYEPKYRNESVSANDSTSNTMGAAIKFNKNNFNYQGVNQNPVSNNIGQQESAYENDMSPEIKPKQAQNTNLNKPSKLNLLQKGIGADFSLKILTINGQKVRVQLWDQGSNMNPQSTFQPLYTRHVTGCIIVANTSNPKSLERAHKWKEMFEKKTKVPDEPSVPATIFINHDIELAKDSREIKEYQKIEEDQDDYILSPERTYSHSDTEDQAIKSKNETNQLSIPSPQFGQILGQTITSNLVDSELEIGKIDEKSIEKLQTQQQSASIKQQTNSPLIKRDKYIKPSLLKSRIDQNKIQQYEKLALTDKKSYFGVYHVSLGEPESVIDAFESFLHRMINEEDHLRRSSTTDSKFYHDDTIKSKKCICKTLIDGFESQDDDSFMQAPGNQYNGGSANRKQDKSRSIVKHHPHCPMRLQNRGSVSGYNDEDSSFVLRRLNKRRFDKNRNRFELPPNQQGNSCC